MNKSKQAISLQKYAATILPKMLGLLCLLFVLTPQASNAETLASNPILIAQVDEDATLTPRQRQNGNSDNATLPNDDNQGNNLPVKGRQRQNRAGARGGNQAAKGPFGGPLDLSILNLSDDQKQQIRQMREQDAPKARAVKQVVRAKRIELRDLMFDPIASDTQIRAARKELRQDQEQLEDLQFSDFLKLRNILTADQKMQLPDIRPMKGKAQRNTKPEAQVPSAKEN